MSIVETLLVFAGIPLGVVVVVTVGVYGRSTVHQPNRYRPGRPWTYPPEWYLPHPDAVADAVVERVAIEGGAATEAAAVAPVGGANGEW